MTLVWLKTAFDGIDMDCIFIKEYNEWWTPVHLTEAEPNKSAIPTKPTIPTTINNEKTIQVKILT